MTLEELKNRLLGKQIEFHSYGAGALNQCVDLVNYYINTVLDTSTKDYTEIIGTNAKDFSTKYDPEDFEWIVNTPEAVIQRGDIAVWNGRVGGGVGHVAIALSGDVNSFQSLDQNWSQVERVTLETHDYKNVTGWLRPKNVAQTVTISQKELDEIRLARDQHYNDLQEKTKQFEEITKKLEEEQKHSGELLKQLEKLNNKDTDVTEQLLTCQKASTTLQGVITGINKELGISEATPTVDTVKAIKTLKKSKVVEVKEKRPEGLLEKLKFLFS